MREALRHLVEDVPACGPDGYAGRWLAQAEAVQAAADALSAELLTWDGEGYLDTIASWKKHRGMIHAAGVYRARAAGIWRQCHGHDADRPSCPGCQAVASRR